jgi:tetratricopeptide (TPR) repeat protein
VKKQILSLIILSFSLLMTVAPLSAQEGYRLRTPTAEEYIERITAIAQQPGRVLDWPTRTFYDNLSVIAFTRFPDLSQVSFEKITAAYNAMAIAQDGYFWQRGLWVEAIFNAWLQQTHPDLSESQTLYFDNFHIRVTPRDFDSDSENEYVLDVIKGQPTDRYDCRYEAEYVNYLVVQPVDSGYQIIETPLYWEGYGNGSAGSNFGEGGQVELNFEDINADGLPEWLVLVGGETFGGPGSGYEAVGQLYILGWRDGHLVDLAALGDGNRYPYSVTFYGEDSYSCDGAVPRDVKWEFVNVDEDDAQEILQRQVYLDNWQCVARETKVINWSGEEDRYIEVDTYRDFPDDSRNCAHRQAEEAMWAGDYAEALEHYERALTLPPYIDPTETNPEVGEYSQTFARNRRVTYEQYHMARMALAYQLTEQPQKAQSILEVLSTEEITFEPMQHFVNALLAAPNTPLGACLAVYTTFAVDWLAASNYLFGVTVEKYVGADSDYSPRRIGCDAPVMVETALQLVDLSTNRLPSELFATLGVPVSTTLHADLNGDGIDEWLLWPENMNPVFFAVNDAEQYVLSTPAVDPYQQSTGIHLWQMPDGVGTAIGYLTPEFARYYPEPWACAYDPICGMGGGGMECVPDGFIGLSMWRMEDLMLTPILNDVTVCRADFSTLFPNGEGSTLIDGGAFRPFEAATSTGNSIQYVWNSNSHTFELTATPVPNTPAPTSVPTPEPQYRWFEEALNALDYAAALAILDENAALEEDYYRDNPESLYMYQYKRAFILEALNRPNEALAEYVAIYEAAPESAWGQIAALHFERVE